VSALGEPLIKPTGRTEYIFQTTWTMKGQAAALQTVIDATQYGTDCDNGAPDLTRLIGQRIRVTAKRSSGEEATSKPTYFVSFSFCGSSFRLLSGSPVGY